MPGPPEDEEDALPPLKRLADAAPRLEVLIVNGFGEDAHVFGIAEAVHGHPCLRELRLQSADKAWLHAIPLLPALATLDVSVPSEFFLRDEMDGDADATAQELRMCGWLARCKQLSDLDLKVEEVHGMPAHQLLTAVGAAVDGRLRL